MQLPAKQLTWVTGSSGSNPDLSASTFTFCLKKFSQVLVFRLVIVHTIQKGLMSLKIWVKIP